MEAKIHFRDDEVQKLLTSFYLIPDYQREYIWGEQHVSQLLNDIYEQFQVNAEVEYFLGTIVVCKDRSKDSIKYEVIDGQQRLITLSLILNVFRRLLKSHGENINHIAKLLYSSTSNVKGEAIDSEILDVQYEGHEVLYDLFKANADQSIKSTLIEGKPGKTIYEAHGYIESFIKENFDLPEDLKELKHFSGYILNNVKIIQIETPSLGNALKIFETINERGIGLDDVDLLKNLLFMQVSREDFQKLKSNWNKFKNNIQGKKVKEKPLRFLRYFIMANYKIDPDKKGSIIIREDDVYSWFSKNEKKCNYKRNSFNFVRKLQESASFYMGLMQNKFNGKDNLYLENISFLVGKAAKQHYILLLAAAGFKEEQFNLFTKSLETLLFYYTITKEPSRDLEKRFADWAQEIQNIKDDVKLKDFIQNRLASEIKRKQPSFKNNFKAPLYSNIQKYKTKYILSKFDHYLEKNRSNSDDFSLSSYFKRNVHIEHILPEERDQDILNSRFDNDIKEYDSYKDKIGNLTLLEEPINTSIKNKKYSLKKPEYKKSKFYLTKSIAAIENVGKNTAINRINTKLRSFNKWEESDIETRQEMLLNLVDEIWAV